MIPSTKRRTWAIINLQNAKNNYNQIKQQTKSKICCVVKANAYGHGAVRLSQLYQELGADYLAVSNIEEALQLRNNNIKLPILILGYTPYECAKILSDNDITQCVYSYEYGLRLSEMAKKNGVVVNIHIKLDTGMGRIGFICRDSTMLEIERAIDVCKMPNLYAEGVFTHFATADEGKRGQAYTQHQFECFINAIEYFKTQGVEFDIKHCANSATIFNYPKFHLDMVRAGVVLYGLTPSEYVNNSPKLRAVMSVYSVITQIKTMAIGQSIGYGGTYTAFENQRIATVAVGYADGLRRLDEESQYCVYVNGCLAPIRGRICMDQITIDVTGIECEVGDTVLLFGDNYEVNADKLAQVHKTINYEIICNVGERVPRFYI